MSVATNSLQLCLTLQPHGMQTASFLCPWVFPGKNTGVGSHFLLQGIFLTQGSNPCLLSPDSAGRFFTTAPPGKPVCGLLRTTSHILYSSSCPFLCLLSSWLGKLGLCPTRGSACYLVELFGQVADRRVTTAWEQPQDTPAPGMLRKRTGSRQASVGSPMRSCT